MKAIDNITGAEYKMVCELAKHLEFCLEYPQSTLLGDYDLEAIDEALKGLEATIEAFKRQKV